MTLILLFLGKDQTQQMILLSPAAAAAEKLGVGQVD